MDQETKAVLIHKYYAGETTAEEEALLEEHFATADDQLPADATGAIFRYAKTRKADMPPPALAKKLIALPLKEHVPYKYWWQVAAAIIIMIGAGWLTLHLLGFRQMTIDAKKLSDTILPDGTHVWINAGSTITYEQAIFSDLREVTLEGEAYFEVAKNRNRPHFIIHTGQAATTVTGTAFNLRNVSGEGFIELSVLSGAVMFGQTNFKKVDAGMQAILHKQKDSPQIRHLQTANATAWKDSKLSFNNAALTDVIHDIARYFRTDIRIESPGAESCHLTAEFTHVTLKDVLSILEETLPASHRVENNTYYITLSPCDR